MRGGRFCNLLMALAVLGAVCVRPEAAAADETPPQRVVSMNLCTDQLAMLIAGPEQLVSVSFLASDPHSSAMPEAAAAYHANHGQAEEVAYLRPDLVLVGEYTTRTTVDMLRRLGIRVEVFAQVRRLDEIAGSMRRMGVLLGRQERAESVAAAVEHKLARLPAPAGDAPEAALYYPRGYASGAGGLDDQIVTASGLSNIAPKLGLPMGGVLPLEALVLSGVDLVIRSAGYGGHSRASELLSHPVLAGLIGAPERPLTTGPDWVCGLPSTLGAVSDLRVNAGLGAK